MSAAQRVSRVDNNSPASKRKMAAAARGDQSSLNHLLNFSLPPRQPRALPPPRRSRKAATTQGFWNKRWNDILQVIVPRASALSVAGSLTQDASEGNTTCPICLSPPSAPRMTKCGHIFCFPCILHYLGMSETVKWARCPICFDTVASHQLRSVHWIDEITTLALPRSASWPSDILAPHQAPFHFLPDVFAFSKFMIATSDYMRLGDSLSVSFVVAADEKIRRQVAKAVALDTRPLRETELRARRETEDLVARAQRRAEYDAQRRDGASAVATAVVAADLGEVPEALLQASGRNMRPRKNVNPPPPSSQTYYFYQAASGAPVFLHPLDIRTLVARFGSYSAFPDTISVRVEAAQEGSVDDALRKRCKYLGHFAESADVVFVETDLRDVVGDEALVPFEAALRMRRSRRKDKDKKDDKARAKAEATERARLGIRPVTEPVTYSPTSVATGEIWEEVPADVIAASSAVPPSQAVVIDTTEEDYAPPPHPALSGAWGSRSFAGVLHGVPMASVRRVHDHEDDGAEEIDSAWAELEVGTGKGNANKRGGKKKLMLIGGGGGGARRRR
ncbi:hypothetical protein BKA62DRAFT_770655 [Auriculariales sp. MPI-PUGE-AT-0066]|nr:hypothetical protein BKA62DRAFT_770655 [Auriculariales sp. MPI-PUGE-AT-0066]